MKKMYLSSWLGIFLLLTVSGGLSQNSSRKVVSFVGTSKFNPGKAASAPANRTVKGPDEDVTFDIPGISGNNSPARLPSDFVPRPAGNSVVSNPSGFTGLDQFLQAIAPTGFPGGDNGQLEPPDQGLAVGSGFVVEPINNAIAMFDTHGNFFGFEALSAFFGLTPTFFVSNSGQVVGPFGPFLSDPKAYYDATNRRFFVTELIIGVDAATGNLTSSSGVLIAVSQTNNPLGAWNVFLLDTSNDGDARFGGCPTGCFGDQPLIGADANGFYISTNAFALPPGAFKGGQLYAMSLSTLENTNGGPVSAVHFGNLDAAGMPARSVQPATIPPGGSFETGQGGTEYFVSALDPAHTVDNRVAVWALSNTGSLNSTPALHLSNVIVTTEAYGFPPATDQESGPTPFLDFLATQGFKNHEELVAANDDRMQQVVFAAGKLWTAVPTKVKPGGQGAIRAGAAWFIFSPSVSGGQVSASVANQGYISIQSPMQNSVLFPAVGVTAEGKAAVVFSVAGENYFPSAAYASLDAVSGAGPIVITGPGFAPDDGFSAYSPFVPGRVARWGDYSAAVADENGNLWMATESINPPLPPESQLPPGALAANFGTFITEVKP